MKTSDDTHRIDNLLPVIRSFPAAGTTPLDRLQEGLAIYRDRVVVFETKHPRELPEKLWEAEGWKYFKQTVKVQTTEIIVLENVVEIRTSNRKRFGSWWLGSCEEGRELRIYLNDGRAGHWFLPESDAEGIRTAFSHLAEDRFIDHSDLPSWPESRADCLSRCPGSPALLALFLLFLAVVLACPFTFSALAWTGPWPQGSYMSKFCEGVREAMKDAFPTKNSTEIANIYERSGQLIGGSLFSANLGEQVTVVIPGLALELLAYPGSAVLMVWILAAGVVITSPLRLWSNARARETDFRRRLSRKRAAKATAYDLSARRPLRLLWAGRSLKLVGALVIIGGLVFVSLLVFSLPMLYDEKELGHSHSFSPNILRLLFLFCGGTLIYFGHRLARRDGPRALVKDRRPPIVYLRPFVIDGRYNFNPSGLLAQLLGLAPFGFLRVLGPLGNLHPLRLTRLFFGSAGEHSEEQMAHFFHQYGPFVTFGKPGERIARTGALRLFVGNTEWQVMVDELLSRAAMVVLQPSDSEGIRWEVERVLNTMDLGKVLICLQLFDGRQGRYDQFRIWAEESAGVKLPRSIGDTVFLFFDQDRQAQRLGLCMRLPVFWPMSSCAVNFKRTTSPFLASLGRTRSKPEARPANGVSRAFWAIIAFVIWSVVLTIPVQLIDWLLLFGGVEEFGILHESNDGQWAWRLPAAWRRVELKKLKFAAAFERAEHKIPLEDVVLKIEEVPPDWASLERVADEQEEEFRRLGFAPGRKQHITSRGRQWAETEYRVTTDNKMNCSIMRVTLAGRQMVTLIGDYEEIPSNDQENERRHRQTLEALAGFSWKPATAIPATSP
jgi:hypothetical protein